MGHPIGNALVVIAGTRFRRVGDARRAKGFGNKPSASPMPEDAIPSAHTLIGTAVLKKLFNH